jgi:CRISPR/Cas system CMR-associated protein Cmr5 small subunit
MRPYLKKHPTLKRAGGMVQVVEFLSTKHEALISNPSKASPTPAKIKSSAT